MPIVDHKLTKRVTITQTIISFIMVLIGNTFVLDGACLDTSPCSEIHVLFGKLSTSYEVKVKMTSARDPERLPRTWLNARKSPA